MERRTRPLPCEERSSKIKTCTFSRFDRRLSIAESMFRASNEHVPHFPTFPLWEKRDVNFVPRPLSQFGTRIFHPRHFGGRISFPFFEWGGGRWQNFPRASFSVPLCSTFYNFFISHPGQIPFGPHFFLAFS